MMGLWAFLKFGLPIGALLLLGAYGTGYFKGKWGAEKRCETASLMAEIAKLKQEKAVAEAADAEQEKAKTELETEKAELEKIVEGYADELAKRPDRCAVNADDLRRMQ